MASLQFKYLRPEDLRKLASFEFAPKLLVEGYLAGRHRSLARGSSIEFRDYRQYVPGDDPRLIDWRIYARTDRPYLRTYEEETNMECHVFLDSSASMGCTEGGQTRFAAACANASDILGGLTARDQANIVWLRSRSRAEFPALGINVSALQVALRRAAVTSETGNPLDAWQMALELLKDAEGRREIHVVSDFQAPQWDRVRLGAPAGVEVVHLRIGDDVVANGALADIHLEPARPLAGEEVSICCEVDNFSPKPERRTVFLSVEEHRESKEVTAPAWGRAVAVFQHRFARAGSYPVTAQLNEDRYPGDDTRWAVPEVRDTLRVGLLAREPATAEVWRRALEAVGWARVEQLAAADLAATSAFDAVLLAGDGGDALRTLRGTLGAGSTVIWYPGTNLDAAVLSEAFGAAPQPAPLWRAGTKPHSLRLAAEGDPVFRIFSGGEYGNPAAGAVYARLDLSPLAAYDAVLVGKGAEYFLTPERIALLRRFVSGQGACLIFTRGKPYSGTLPELESLEPVAWGPAVNAAVRFAPARSAGPSGLFGAMLPGAGDPVWERLPPLQVASRFSDEKPFTRILAEGAVEPGGSRGTLPLLAARRVGRGLVLTMNAEDFWRWDFFPSIPEAPEVYREFWPHWVAQISGDPPGLYRVEVMPADAGAPSGAAALLEVKPPPAETDNLSVDRVFLETLARESGGAVVTGRELTGVVERLDAPEETRTTGRTIWEPVWNRAWVLVSILALLAGEWFLRRRAGLM